MTNNTNIEKLRRKADNVRDAQGIVDAEDLQK